MKKIFAIAAIAAVFASCAGKTAQNTENTESEATQEVVTEQAPQTTDSLAVEAGVESEAAAN